MDEDRQRLAEWVDQERGRAQPGRRLRRREPRQTSGAERSYRRVPGGRRNGLDQGLGGELIDGRIYGRGACDMKAGTSASIFTYVFLHRIRERLKGRLTLTAVSDEETFGPWGARYLVEHHPEVLGDCLLNDEPGSPYTIRFGEKGPLWLEFKIRTRGAHGAYTHASESVTKLAQRLIADLEAVTLIEPKISDSIARSLEAAREPVDKAMGEGASDIVSKVTLNNGVIEGGLKVNMVPFACRFEADIRLPLDVTRGQVMMEVNKVLARYPQATVEEIKFNPPSYCPPDGAMVGIIQKNVQDLRGFKPQPIVSLGGRTPGSGATATSRPMSTGPSPMAWARPTSKWIWRSSCTSSGSMFCQRTTI